MIDIKWVVTDVSRMWWVFFGWLPFSILWWKWRKDEPPFLLKFIVLGLAVIWIVGFYLYYVRQGGYPWLESFNTNFSANHYT